MSSSPASSSSSGSLSRIRQHLHSHSSYTQQRATKASDLACLLDPSYTHHQSHTASQIYVDHAGEAHDPDFRLFNYSPRRREFMNLGGVTGKGKEEEEFDEEESEREEYEELTRRASIESYYRPASRMSDPSYYAASSPSKYASYAYAVEDGYDDEPKSPASPTSKKLRRRRASHGDADADLDAAPELPSPASADSHSPATPSSCHDVSYTVRRSWQAFTMRTQVAAYRARKRMLGIVHVGSTRRSTL
ncbi:hypothetical protein M422DRAFT_255689 [Sphaerobolus stellatus SS14]|nr:hypothetical protein M422DRAFT_255689 [Sphaerobolus stellatus SS14]